MKTENRVLMQRARESLSGKWGLAVGTFLLYNVVAIAVQSIQDVGFLLSLVITGPMILGLSIFSLALSRNQEPRLEQIFEGFKRFTVSLTTYLLYSLFVFLWTLLLIVPGIIAALSYSMTFYILADDPSIGSKEAIKKSKKMMYGYKWKLFLLQFRFLGWMILSILSLGIGFLWLMPYMQITSAKFYEDIKNSATESTPISPPPVMASTPTQTA